MVSNLAYNQNVILVDETDIKNDVVKWCSVSLAEVISSGNRFEATVFDIDARYAHELINQIKYDKITLCGDNGFSTAYHRPRFKRTWAEFSELPIYQPSSILDIMPKPDGYISEKTDTNIEMLRVKKGQILLTCSGTVGKVALVSRTLDGKIFSHDLIRISCKNNSDIGFLYAYLKSDVGNKILQTNRYGSVITHIEPEHLTDIPVPNPPFNIKKKINDLIMRSYELRDESNELIDKATNMLIKELKLPPIHELKVDRYDNKAEVDTFNISLSRLYGRADASYHVPIVKSIIDHLKVNAKEVTIVGDARISKKIVLAGIFKRVYVDKEQGIPFLGGKEISQLNPNVEKFLSRPHHKARYEKELKVTENMILVTDRGTVGEVALVPKHFQNWAVSQNVLKLVPKNDEISGYCYIFLNTEYGKVLIKQQIYGSVIDMIDNKSLGNVSIPILKNTNIQTEINSLALEANAKRYESYKLEQKAMAIMDKEVFFLN